MDCVWRIHVFALALMHIYLFISVKNRRLFLANGPILIPFGLYLRTKLTGLETKRVTNNQAN